MDDKTFPTEFATEALKGAPPVAVAVTTVAGAIDWQSWVMILTAIYVLLQIVYLVAFKMFGLRFSKTPGLDRE